MARLATGMLVAALIRRVEGEGGNAAVLARGDATAGSILVQLAHRGIAGDLVERTLDSIGRYRWTGVGPDEADRRAEYLARRRRVDPDLWVLELDHADAATILADATDIV